MRINQCVLQGHHKWHNITITIKNPLIKLSLKQSRQTKPLIAAALLALYPS